MDDWEIHFADKSKRRARSSRRRDLRRSAKIALGLACAGAFLWGAVEVVAQSLPDFSSQYRHR